MAKLIFPFEIKYNDKYYSIGSAVEASEKEVDELLAAGGKLIEEDASKSKEHRETNEDLNKKAAPKSKVRSKARGKNDTARKA